MYIIYIYISWRVLGCPVNHRSFEMIIACATRRRPSESAWLHDLVQLGAPRRCKGLIQGKTPWEILVSSSRHGEVQQICLNVWGKS